METIEKTAKYAILRGCASTNEEVMAFGGTAFDVGEICSDPKSELLHAVRCGVIADYGLDIEGEDVVVIFDPSWAKKIEDEIRVKLLNITI